MKSISKILLATFILSVFVLSNCKKDAEPANAVADRLVVGDSSVQVYDTIVQLKVKALSNGQSGKWTVLNDATNTGWFDNATDPGSYFHGKLLNTYTVRWEVSNGSEAKHNDFLVKFILPDKLVDTTTLVVYVNDTTTIDPKTALNGLHLISGVTTGTWSVVSDTTQTARFDNVNKPTTTFHGGLGYGYVLKWEVAAGSTKKSQLVVVKFSGMTDTRDKEKYDIVRIGGKTGKVWLANNLRYLDATGTFLDMTYYNLSTLLRNSYGCLYTYQEASSVSSNPLKQVAPQGWRLSTDQDWSDLELAVNHSKFGASVGQEANYLKAKKGWSNNGNGVDSLGFSILPGGICTSYYVPISNMDSITFTTIPTAILITAGTVWSYSSTTPGVQLYFQDLGRISWYWTEKAVGTKVTTRCFSDKTLYYKTSSTTGAVYSLPSVINNVTLDYTSGYLCSMRCVKN
jgi:uncharacterized protein (TIGR02145 family)